MELNKDLNFYFFEKRLKISSFSNFIFKAANFSFYVFLVFLTFFAILSDVRRLNFVGILLLLFLIDRFIHLNDGERELRELLKFNLVKKNFNLSDFLSKEAKNLIVDSYHKAKVFKKNFYAIFIADFFKTRYGREILKRLEINEALLEEKIIYFQNQEEVSELENYKKVEKLVEAAFNEAVSLNEMFIYSRNLFSALIKIEDDKLKEFFSFFNLAEKDFRELSIFLKFLPEFLKFKRIPTFLGEFGKHFLIRNRKGFYLNRSWTARTTPFLDNFSTDLTYLAKQEKIGFLIGHQKEFNRLLDIVCREVKPNALLIGEPSSGKTTIINHLAYLVAKDEVPEEIFDKRVVALDISLVMSNATSEVIVERLRKIIDDIYNTDNIILVLPDFDKFAKSVESNVILPIDVILPLIKNDRFPVIAEANFREYKEFLENRSDIIDLFEVVKVEEISEEEALRFLIFSTLILEKEFKIKTSFNVLKKAVGLAKKYFRDKLLPSSAYELLKQVFDYAKKNKIKFINEKIIIDLAQEKTSIPLKQVEAYEKEKLLYLEDIIHQTFINQDIAVKAVSNVLREYRSGLRGKKGPIASFLFVGPTGVGKTELAKVLANIEFGSEENMIRFDMSEFQNKDSIARFLGSGEKDVLSLTELVYRKPYCLILLDEFEKAHPDILNLFLQVFDDGRLTDFFGKTIDFGNSIIIATSNAHSDFIKSALEEGKDIAEISEELKKKLSSFFRPELINRFSDIIVFRNLNLDEIVKIAELKLKSIKKIIKESKNIELEFSLEVIKKIAEKGFDPVFGARPLDKIISQEIKSKLAELILLDKVKTGSKVKWDLKDGQIYFEIS